MKEKYEEIAELDKLNSEGSISTHLAKLMEEMGEFATEANKLSGVKRNKDNQSVDEIINELTYEAADCIQIIMVICSRVGVNYDQLVKALGEKNGVWKNGYLVKKENGF